MAKEKPVQQGADSKPRKKAKSQTASPFQPRRSRRRPAIVHGPAPMQFPNEPLKGAKDVFDL